MTTQRRGPYAKTAQVRRRIVEVALGAFAETGYRATTMKEIALRADISERGIVHHFPTKEDLLLEVLALYEEESARIMPVEADHRQIDGLLAVARHNQQHPEMLELQNLLGAEGTSAQHPAHERFVRRYEDLRWVLADVFSELAQRGAVQVDVEPDRLATMYTALLDGLQLQWLYNRDAVDVEGMLRDFLSMVCPNEPFVTPDQARVEVPPA
jgi:AcrR family transcriptional regulator